jgi:ribosomal protein S27AE
LARAAGAGRFVLVSEGSFGPAPGMAFVARGVEMLLLQDEETGIEVVEQSLTLETNYATDTVRSSDRLSAFLDGVSFGTHAVVMYPAGRPPTSLVYKGLVALAEAERAFEECRAASPEGAVVVMSDMRAHVNPTRMKAIATCCEFLAHRLATECPDCGSGGFGLVSSIPGLPCAECGAETRLARAERHQCAVCGTTRDLPRADGTRTADPGACEFCNA